MALWDNPNAWPVVDFDSPLGKVAQYNNLSDAVQKWRGNVNANNKAVDNLIATTFRLSGIAASQAGISVQTRSNNNRFLFSANAAAGSGGSDYIDFLDHDIATKTTYGNGVWRLGQVYASNVAVSGQVNTPSLTNGAASAINLQDSFLDRLYALQFKCLNPTSNNVVAGSAPLLNFQVIANGGNSSGVNDRLIFYGITKISDTALSATSLMELWRDSSLVRFPTTTLIGPAVGAIGSVQITSNQPSPVSGKLLFGGDGSGWQFRIARNLGGTVTDMMSFVDVNRIDVHSPTHFGSTVKFNTDVTMPRINNGLGGEIEVNSGYLQHIWVLNFTCYGPQSNVQPGGINFQVASFGGTSTTQDKLQISRITGGGGIVSMMKFENDGRIWFDSASYIKCDSPTQYNAPLSVSSLSDPNRAVVIEKDPNYASMTIHTDALSTASQSRIAGLTIRANYSLLPVYMQNLGGGVWPGDGVLQAGDLLMYQLAGTNNQLRLRMRCGDGVVREITFILS